MLKIIFAFFSIFKNKAREKGQGMVEYALILAAVAIIAVIAIWGGGDTSNQGNSLKSAVTGAFSKAASEVQNAQKNQ